MRRLLLCSLLTGLLTAPCAAQQPGLWERASGAGQRGRHAVQEKKAAWKTWTRRLNDWSADTSYSREAGLTGRLHSDGWAVGLSGARKGDGGRAVYGLALLLEEVVHEKQVKQQAANALAPQLGAGAPFVFGKINNLYTLSMLVTADRPLLPGVLAGTASVGWRWGAGPGLALLKPYYLELVDVDYTGPQPVTTVSSERFTEANASRFLDRARIIGAGRWSRGLDAVQYVPGLQGELALTITPTRPKALVPTLVLGAAGAVYTRSLPILADVSAQAWQARLFAGVLLGRRW